ncbi:MAG: stage III sporulation protein AG [Oscillospiraceae bacterium]
MKEAEKWRGVWNKYKYVALVALAGIVLLLMPVGGRAEEPEPPPAVLSVTGEEAKMQEILSKIKGVGQVQLMLTLERGEERQYAQDTELSYRGAVEAPSDYARRSETVVLSEGGGGEGSLPTQSIYPIYRGALAVCEGGDNPAVQLAVTQALCALTGLRADRISVSRWQS